MASAQDGRRDLVPRQALEQVANLLPSHLELVDLGRVGLLEVSMVRDERGVIVMFWDWFA